MGFGGGCAGPAMVAHRRPSNAAPGKDRLGAQDDRRQGGDLNGGRPCAGLTFAAC